MRMWKYTLLIAIVIIGFLPGDALAMSITSVERIWSASAFEKKESASVDLFSDEGERLTLITDFRVGNNKHNENCKLRLIDQKTGKEVFSRKVQGYNLVSVRKVHAINPNKTFWFINIANAASAGGTENMYLIGKYKDQYVSFISGESMREMGWHYGLNNGMRAFDGGLMMTTNFYSYEPTKHSVPGPRYMFRWDDGSAWFSVRYLPEEYDI